jgi:hypothetical protein
MLAAFSLACLAAGCGPKPLPFADKVEGTLTSGNKPLVGVRVQFVPQVEEGVQAVLSSATTDEKGHFSLMRDDTGKPGAVLGKHKVLLVAGRMSGGDRSSDGNNQSVSFSSPVPKEYSNLATTPLAVEVKAEQANYPLVVVGQ